MCFHTRWGMSLCPPACRRLYDETVHLLEGKTRTPLPHKLPGAYRCLPGAVYGLHSPCVHHRRQACCVKRRLSFPVAHTGSGTAACLVPL